MEVLTYLQSYYPRIERETLLPFVKDYQNIDSNEGYVRRIFVGLQPTVIASRAPHLLLEQSVQDSKNRGRASPVKRISDLPVISAYNRSNRNFHF